tara:strand:- start:919 stop:1698 length:780 start_codon:yes stop_codon:yes gene_type:complete
MNYKKKYLKYKLKYLLTKKKTLGGKPNAPVRSREGRLTQHKNSGYFNNAYLTGFGDSVGNTLGTVVPTIAIGMPGANALYNVGSSIFIEGEYEKQIYKVLNIENPTEDNKEKALLTINTIMDDQKEHNTIILKLNQFIANFLKTWKKQNNKTHWYQVYIEQDIEQKTNELDEIYKNFKEATSDNLKSNAETELIQELAKFSHETAGLDLSVLGLENPTKYDELMKSLQEQDGSGFLDVAVDTIGDFFSSMLGGGKKNKK